MLLTRALGPNNDNLTTTPQLIHTNCPRTAISIVVWMNDMTEKYFLSTVSKSCRNCFENLTEPCPVYELMWAWTSTIVWVSSLFCVGEWMKRNDMKLHEWCIQWTPWSFCQGRETGTQQPRLVCRQNRHETLSQNCDDWFFDSDFVPQPRTKHHSWVTILLFVSC